MPTNDFKLKELAVPCGICIANLNSETALKIENPTELEIYQSLELTKLRCDHVFHTACMVGGWVVNNLYYCCP